MRGPKLLNLLPKLRCATGWMHKWKMRRPCLKNALSLALVPFVVTLCTPPARAHENDDCQLIHVTVPVSKEVVIRHNGYWIDASCMAEAHLTKCEGACESTVTPSVRSHTGFQKNCRCCKADQVTTTTLVLTRCHNATGHELPGVTRTTPISIIQSCSCHSCS